MLSSEYTIYRNIRIISPKKIKPILAYLKAIVEPECDDSFHAPPEPRIV
jgi:hypothetical protein